MVATSQPLAVAAGLEILSGGGNAADAAVATAAALNVTEPTSTGLGGDCFALYYQADSGSVHALNGSGRAPQDLTIERLRREGLGRELPPFHPYTITVPGAPAGWCDLVERFGTLSMAEVLSPAIRLAENGFPVSPVTAHFWEKGFEKQLRTAPGGLELTVNGKPPRAGQLFRNPGLARSFKVIAREGKNGFYSGEIGRAVVNVVRTAGGCLSEEDLGAHRSAWVTPISTIYRGLRVWECPPNGQGLAALLALNILEGFDLGSLEPLSASRLHLEIEAMRLAFADACGYIADPEFNPAPVEALLSKDYAEQRRKLIDRERATLDQVKGSPFASSDTVYLSVMDGAGNACSFINSNYMGFGTGIVPSGWGFSLQNRGANFRLDPAHPNALEPGKRPYHTIIPGLVTTPLEGRTRGDPKEELYACFGVMGGFMQPQGHVQVLTGLIDDGLDPQSALDRPRFCITNGEAGGQLALESGMPAEVFRKLSDIGHDIQPGSEGLFHLYGLGQIILRNPQDGVLCAGSDPRADGCAMTY